MSERTETLHQLPKKSRKCPDFWNVENNIHWHNQCSVSNNVSSNCPRKSKKKLSHYVAFLFNFIVLILWSVLKFLLKSPILAALDIRGGKLFTMRAPEVAMNIHISCFMCQHRSLLGRA